MLPHTTRFIVLVMTGLLLITPNVLGSNNTTSDNNSDDGSLDSVVLSICCCLGLIFIGIICMIPVIKIFGKKKKKRKDEKNITININQ